MLYEGKWKNLFKKGLRYLGLPSGSIKYDYAKTVKNYFAKHRTAESKIDTNFFFDIILLLFIFTDLFLQNENKRYSPPLFADFNHKIVDNSHFANLLCIRVTVKYFL